MRYIFQKLCKKHSIFYNRNIFLSFFYISF
nr:MAG TPA: hypothetical protein [Caudoviricetes sp.]